MNSPTENRLDSLWVHTPQLAAAFVPMNRDWVDESLHP